ncbi:MAG: hypothetical protein K2M07_04195 [Muribaculaceae bacterium]|nr:hypothetical protein [Muribaculaceae bacterium]
MKRLPQLIAMVLTAIACMQASTPDDYDLLARKERMFYNAREWPGASAMLSLMIDERPAQPDLYGRAIVAQSLMNDTTGAIGLLDQAMKNKVPFDSVFSNVKTESFRLGRSDLYEDFLVRVKRTHPWLVRTIDNYLLDYYCFRRDGAKMVEYSRMMLEGLPDNTFFLTILAEGYLLEGETELAVLTFRQVLYFNPTDYNATLYLANYYFNRWERSGSVNDHQQALTFMSRADELKSTPFIEKRLERLRER